MTVRLDNIINTKLTSITLVLNNLETKNKLPSDRLEKIKLKFNKIKLIIQKFNTRIGKMFCILVLNISLWRLKKK